jgi:hypothetical protein
VNADASTPRVLPTEFGALVLTAYDGEERTFATQAADPGERCWRCDTPARGPLDDAGLCGPCGADLRGP